MNELPAGLTAEQAEVLRLVQQNLSSKEIARLLGISKSAIDQRLDRARQVLGASSRREAARIFAGLEA
ncbi:helix-turn-helix transcriptional regulator, partial [Escherichia coli]|nr:helix-turn-helix transcriptional regulator [Escherichia coli]